MEQNRTKLLFYFPDNAAVGAFAVTRYSSAASSGMHGDRLYPFRPGQQLSPTWHHLLEGVEVGGRVLGGGEMEFRGLKVQRQHHVLLGTWLKPRYTVQAQLGFYHDARHWRTIKYNQLFKYGRDVLS